MARTLGYHLLRLAAGHPPGPLPVAIGRDPQARLLRDASRIGVGSSGLEQSVAEAPACPVHVKLPQAGTGKGGRGPRRTDGSSVGHPGLTTKTTDIPVTALAPRATHRGGSHHSISEGRCVGTRGE